MKFSDFIPTSAIIMDLKATEKKETIKEMVEKVKDVFNINEISTTEIIDALMKREKIGSTGIGSGIAVPHAKLDGLKGVVGVFGRSTHGVEFDAVDGAPVHLIFLELAPTDQPEQHLQALQHISRAIKRPNFAKFLRNAKDLKTIVETFKEVDA